MKMPVRVNTTVALVWLRADLARQEARAYWRGPHGQIANKVPCIYEYVQHHFSSSVHGFWPVPPGIGGITPVDWMIDGIAEVRVRSVFRGLYDRFFHMKGVFHDEFNVFDRVVPNTSAPGGSLWWTGDHRKDVGIRAVVFFRARHELRGKPFARFMEQIMAPALLAAGASELRSHIFAPGGRFSLWTPDVRHDYPANRRYAGALVIGAKSLDELNKILNSRQLTATLEEQRRHCVAIHSYVVENSYPWKLNNIPQPWSGA
jgi:hypothetical protein